MDFLSFIQGKGGFCLSNNFSGFGRGWGGGEGNVYSISITQCNTFAGVCCYIRVCKWVDGWVDGWEAGRRGGRMDSRHRVGDGDVVEYMW